MAACSGAVVVTDDADRFHQALRPSGGNFTVTAPGVFAAKHVRIDLPRVLMQGAQETLPRIWEGDLSHERHVISCQISPGPSLFANGAEIGPGEIVLHSSSAAMLCHRTTGPTRWGGMSLPFRDWEAIAIAVGHDLTPRADVPKITTGNCADQIQAPARFGNGYGRKCAATPRKSRCGSRSGIRAGPGNDRLSRDVREPVIHGRYTATRDDHEALLPGPGSQRRRTNLPAPALHRHRRIRRILRLCCQEYLGIGPKRYLHLRRMHLARRALLRRRRARIT